MRAVARAHAVSLSTVQWWVRRAGDGALDQVEWADRPPLAKQIHRTASAVEDLVLSLRRELKDTSDLGEYGAACDSPRTRGARGHPADAVGADSLAAFWIAGAPWMTAGGSAARRPRPGGTFPRSRAGELNLNVPTPSRAWRSREAGNSRSSPSSPCMGGCPAPGRKRW